MTVYQYKAKKQNAETVSGQITAQSQEQAIDLIHQLGFLPVSVEPLKLNQKKTKVKNRRIRLKDRTLFTRQLADLLRSGETLLRSLEIIEQQTQNDNFKQVIENIVFSVKGGKSFSESLRVYPKIFSRLYVNMVHSGEESGNLEEMLVSIAAYEKKQHAIAAKVRSAFAYPLFMGVVGCGTIIFILTFVLPRMASLFENLGSSLPALTAGLLALSAFMKTHAIGLLVVIFFLLLFWRQFSDSQAVSSIRRLMLKIPVIGEIKIKGELLRFCRTLALLLQSGMSLQKALEIAIPVIHYEVMKKHLLQSRQDLIAGGSLGESIKRYPEFPSMMGHLISVGEESGRIESVLSEIADSFEQETDEAIKTMTTLLEPLMILAVGLVVGAIVFAMLLPIFQMDIFSY